MTRSEALHPVRNDVAGRGSRVRRVMSLAVLLSSFAWLSGCALWDSPTKTNQQNNTGHLVITGELPTAKVGVSCNAVFSVSGGNSPYTFAIASGALPPGLTMRATAGSITGIPTKEGTYSFTVQVTDPKGLTGTNPFEIVVSNPTSVSVKVSPGSSILSPYGIQQFSASVSNTSNVGVMWSATVGTVSSSGLYTAPKVTSTTTATVTATSNADSTKSSKATVTIYPASQAIPLSISSTSLPSATSGSSYSDTLLASGGTSPYHWSISSGALPSGLSLSSGGTITGTASQTGQYTLTVQATDSSSPQQASTKSMTLTVNQAVVTGPTVPKSFFGADFNGHQVWPPTDGQGQQATLGGIRLWDDNVKWGHINTANGVYDWSKLDDWLDRAQSANLDVLYTLGYTPDWATSGIQPGMCLQPSGLSCVPPVDVNADGTGTDAYFQAFVTALVQHAAGRISYYELWNEPDCDCFFNGTTAQLIRMSKDASAIIRSLDPQAKILSPSYHKYSMSTKFDDYVAQGGAAYFDIVNVHMRGKDNDNANPEEFLNVYNTVESELVKRNLTSLPLWDDEHGILDDNGLTDPDELAGYVARSAILRASVGIQRQYVYSWDSAPPFGLQGNASGTAWDEVAGWLIGHSLSACTLTGTVYTCQLDNGQIVWDTAQTCSRGTCSTSNYTYPTKYSSYRDMATGSRVTLTGNTVPIGYKPILLTNQ